MNKPAHFRLADLHGFQRLAIDATLGIADLVEAMHHTVTRIPGPLGAPPAGRTTGITGFVYRSVRGVTRVVGAGLDTALGALAPLVAEEPSSQERDAIVAALNGVLGDYLAATGNPLAIPMRLRVNGVVLELERAALSAAVPGAGGRLLVLVHGLCMNDRQWLRQGHDHGAALARDRGWPPVHLHSNSGLHISASGRPVAERMEALVRAWPHPVEQLAIVGHSMGGLVAHGACDHAARAGHAWLARLDHLVFLGSPHFGAPLERAGTRADFLMGISPYSAPFARLGKVRSAGITDLGHGYIADADWQAPAGRSARRDRTPVPLPAGARCYAIAASRQQRPGAAGARVRGDGLVPVASALGRHADPARDLGLPESRRWVGYGMGHFDLLCRRDVYERVRDWLAGSE